MKKLIIILSIVAFVVSCSTSKKTIEVNHKQVKDSVEYELIIFDAGFDSWFVIRDNEAMKKSEEYYKIKNQFYVIEWNIRYHRGSSLYDCYIDYEPHIDYGFDLNYKLYMYFKYFEEKNKVKLIVQ